MSLSPNTQNTQIIANYARKMRDDVTMATAGLEYIFENLDPVNGGSQIKEQIFYQLSTNANVFAGGVAPVNANFVNNATEAVFSPVYYWYSVLIPDTLKITGRGEGEVINLFNGQFQGTFASLVQVMGGDFWGDGSPRNGAPTLSGIAAACTYNSDGAGGAFGGISRLNSSGTFRTPSGNAAFWNSVVFAINGGAQTCWKGVINTGNSTSVSSQSMTAFTSACTVGQYRPNAILADVIAWNSLHNFIVQTTLQAPLQIEGGAGYPTISFAGIPVIQDDYAPTGTMTAVNGLWKLRPWEEGFFVQLEPVRPYNAFATIYYGLTVMNMVHTRPNTIGLMNGILT